MVTRQDIVDEARSYLGVRWKHQGRSREAIDCAGLVICVGRDLGLTHYDYTAYRRRPDHQKFIEYFVAGGGIRLNVADVQPGDVLLFTEYSYPCHSSIVSEKRGVLHIIHSHLPRRGVVEEPLIEPWLSKRVAAFRYPGVED
jgi:cell wall-associated NlpC family hydrolase